MAQITDTSLPPFSAAGDLPAGIYRVTLQQLLRRFGEGSRQRVAAGRRLERIHRIAVATDQVARFVVFGSFVTAKKDPVDVDVFLLMENTFKTGELTGESRVLFDHASAQAHFGASVFWLRRLAALGGEEQTIAGWRVKRDGTLRGIVEIVEEQK